MTLTGSRKHNGDKALSVYRNLMTNVMTKKEEVRTNGNYIEKSERDQQERQERES